MSVPTWKRNESRVQFLYNVYLLEKEIAAIIPKVPAKHRSSFGDTLIKDCDLALFHGRVANRTHVRSSGSLHYRRNHLIEMEAAVDNIGTHTYIWLETVRAHDGIERRLDDKLYKAEDRIGLLCDETIGLIEGLIRSDSDRFNNGKENNSAG